MSDRERVRLNLEFPRPLHNRVTLVALLRGEGKLVWLRRVITEAADRELAAAPSGVRVMLRPNSSVYSMQENKTYTVIARSIGGERVWILSGLEGSLPIPFGGGPPFMVDITVDAGKHGFEGRGVVVSGDDLFAGKLV